MFPFIASLWPKPRERRAQRARSSWSVDVLIPAHNEAGTLRATLDSVARSFAQWQRGGAKPLLSVRVLVGLDACTDRTGDIAISAGAQARVFHHRSKWKTLRGLLYESRADWVALADAGAVWGEGLVAGWAAHLDDESLSGFAPAYHPARASWVERCVWGVERALKSFENEAGGPMSVHGATVFYRRDLLAQVMDEIGVVDWLNDDVVIPLALRARFPDLRLLYWDGYARAAGVGDVGLRAAGDESTRRTRMVAGNLQWMRRLLPRVFRLHPRVGLLALRRVFRVFWAYWLLFAALSLGIPGLVALAAGLLVQPSLRASFVASLRAFPKLWTQPSSAEVTWR
ncbi:MAG: glycosyltransferase [Bdellovibrionales bacterium]|nr:glycosyltransferase [Bdellovibrionales bacterium]